MMTLAWASGAAAQPVALEVRFKLTDRDYKPLAAVPVRIVFGSDPAWQTAVAGQRVVTDAKGEATLRTNVVLDKQIRKMPTNVVSSLLSRPSETDHLRVAAEMEYMEQRWLYVVDVVRFPGGDVMLDDFSLYTADAQGRFTQKAEHNANGWKIAGLGGLMLTKPGYEPYDFNLDLDPADPSRQRWILRLAFIKYPPPVRR
jgi:hypothetical protein